MMTISELFVAIQNKFFPEELKGEFQLQGNCIVWTYDLDGDSEEIEHDDPDDEETQFSFDATSPEELLQDAYDEDFKKIEEFLDEIEETDYWSFSDPETIERIISFKIY